jgi:hypothetical protein
MMAATACLDALPGCQKFGASAIESGHFMGHFMGAKNLVKRTKYSLLYKSES